MFKKIFFLTLLLLTFLGSAITAQNISTFKSGLATPHGLDFDANGNLWVTQIGTGSNDGVVSVIMPDGTMHDVITDLPNLADPVTMEVIGAWRTYQMPNDRLAVVSGEGVEQYSAHILIYDMTGFTLGDAPKTLTDFETAINIGAFIFGEGFDQTNPYGVASNSAGDLFITDAAANALVKWDNTTGDLSIFATFPDFENSFFPGGPSIFPGPPFINAVPTKVLSDGADGFYVSTLTGFPFIEGNANVLHVAPDGTISDHVTGLTMAVDMTVDPTDGELVILIFAQFQLGAGFLPGSSELRKFDGVDTLLTSLARGFGPASGVAMDAAGNAYVSSIFTGEILKIEFIAPANDALCDAIPVTVGEGCNDIPNIDNNLATAETNEPYFTCPGSFGDTVVRNSVWYSFVAPSDDLHIMATSDVDGTQYSFQINLFSLNGECADLSNL